MLALPVKMAYESYKPNDEWFSSGLKKMSRWSCFTGESLTAGRTKEIPSFSGCFLVKNLSSPDE
jgi:hypothetical protein